MYLLNTITEIEWTLDKTPNTITISELSTITVKPNGDTEFTQVQNLVEPTITSQGLILHSITPDVVGLWEITLVKGDAETYTELSKTNMYVFENDTVVEPLASLASEYGINGNRNRHGQEP